MSSPLALPSSPEAVEAKLLYDFDCLVGVTGAFVALSSIAVVLRCYVRGWVTRTFGWDDGLMIGAEAAYILCAILTWISTYAERIVVSTGELTMPMGTLVQLIRFTNAAYTLTMIIAKLSIGVFFLKLFTTTSFKWQRWTIISLMGVSTAFGTAYLIMTFATCGIMVQSQKTTPMHTGSDWCPIQEAFVDVSILYSALNIFTDIAFTALAVFALCNAKMDRAIKVSASLLLAFGSVACVASIMRIVIQTPLSDIRLAGVLLGLWSVIEAGMCISAASLITLRPLVQPAIEKARSSLSSFSKGSRSESVASASAANVSLVKSNAGTELSDLERGNKSAVFVTRTFEIKEKDSDSWSSRS